MSKTLDAWVDEDVAVHDHRSQSWLSQYYFFRDPRRPQFVDHGYFFSPADGIILYQRIVKPDEALVELKGKNYTLREALREPNFQGESLVIGIFMTFFDVHVNRIPYPGTAKYWEPEPVATYNRPMLPLEDAILRRSRLDMRQTGYLYTNQRMITRVYAPYLRQYYWMIQIADYEIDCILPFEKRQNRAFRQNQRFSCIRYGSQFDLIIPLSKNWRFELLEEVSRHVEAGVDPLVGVHAR